MMKTLIIGLGNPILGDDGVGWRVAEQVSACLAKLDPGEQSEIQAKDLLVSPSQVEVTCLSVGGLRLMEHMLGFERVILIDALNTGGTPGAVYCFPLAELPNRALGHLSSSHDTTLQNALSVGRTLGVSLPDQIAIVGIEAEFVYDFNEALSPLIARAVPQATRLVLRLLSASSDAAHWPDSQDRNLPVFRDRTSHQPMKE